MRRRSFLALAASLALISHRGAALAAQTPVPAGDTPLMSLLRRLPGDALGDVGIRVANYDAQLAARGVAGGGSGLDPEAWRAAISERTMLPLAMSDPLNPAWREGLGFDLRDVAAMAEVGPSDASILLLTGRFDAALPAAWAAAGYAPTETAGMTWYTLGEDNVLDFEDPLGLLHLGTLSHLALLDGTVAGTAKQADMERVLAVAGGDGASFGDGPGASLAAAPADLADGWIVAGTVLVATGDPLAAMPSNPNVPADVQERLATQAAYAAEGAPRMPPIALALVGTIAGGAGAAADLPQPHAVAVVMPADPADAAMVAETVTRRLTTESLLGGDGLLGRPWTDAFTAMSVETAPSGAVVIDLTPAEGVPADLLVTLVQQRNLSILYWAG